MTLFRIALRRRPASASHPATGIHPWSTIAAPELQLSADPFLSRSRDARRLKARAAGIGPGGEPEVRDARQTMDGRRGGSARGRCRGHPPGGAGHGGDLNDLTTAPDRSRTLIACGSPYHHTALDAGTLGNAMVYPTGLYPTAITTGAGGSVVVAGSDGDYSNDVFVLVRRRPVVQPGERVQDGDRGRPHPERPACGWIRTAWPPPGCTGPARPMSRSACRPSSPATRRTPRPPEPGTTSASPTRTAG
jgi:hypothetical protein